MKKRGRFNQGVRHLFWYKNVSQKAKLIFYKSYYTLIISYDAETWALNERKWSRAQAGEMKFLRSTMKKRRSDRIRNEHVTRNLSVESVRQQIERSSLRLLGHV